MEKRLSMMNSKEPFATISLYFQAAMKAAKTLLRQPILIPLFLSAFVLYQFLGSVIHYSRLGVSGGFLLALIQLVWLTYLFQWLTMATKAQLSTGRGFFSLKKITEEQDPWIHVRRAARKESYMDVLRFNSELFFALLSVAFPLFIVHLLLSALDNNVLLITFSLSAFVFLNPLPEVIIASSLTGLDAFKEVLDFMRRRFCIWLFPILLPVALKLIASPMSVSPNILSELISLASLSDPIYPTETLHTVVQNIFIQYPLLGSGLGVLLVLYLSLFRLELYLRTAVSPQTL